MDEVLTVDEVRSQLQAQGVSIAEWAREQGFSRVQVYAVLSGRTKGLRGVSHEIAAALNLKPKPKKTKKYQCLNLTKSRDSTIDPSTNHQGDSENDNLI